MNKGKLDVLLAILVVMVMSFHLLPPWLHEYLAIVLLVATVYHVGRNRWWFRSLLHGPWTVARGFNSLVTLVTLVGLIVVMTTGLFISSYATPGWFGSAWQHNLLVHLLHVSLPYVMLAVWGLHIGAHSMQIVSRLKASYGPRTWLFSGPVRVVGGLVAVVGIYGVWANRLLDRIQLNHVFATEAMKLPKPITLLLLVSIIVLFAFIGYGISRLARKVS